MASKELTAERATASEGRSRAIGSKTPGSGRQHGLAGRQVAFVLSGLLLWTVPGVGASGILQPAENTPVRNAGQNPATASLLSVPASSWARETSENEVEIIEHKGSYLRYRMRVVDAKGDVVRDVIESRDGTVARTILKDGRPLTPDEDREERGRLQSMMDSPAIFARHVKRDISGKKMAVDLIRQLPVAMVFNYVEGQPQVAGSTYGNQVVLEFKPNPKYSPPTTPAEALGGLAGRVWIDVKSKRMIRMEGNIFQAVNIGWGMVARVYPGGKLAVDQTNTGGQRWIFTHFSEQLTVRALMVKQMNEQAEIDAQDFQTLTEGMSYQDAIRSLLNTPLPAK